MAFRSGLQHLRWRIILYVSLFILLATLAAADSTAAYSTVSGSNSTATTAAQHHKSLMPLAGTDIGLFIVVAVALFIASGAGVGGGVLVVPALLVISQFSAIAAVALSNITILASSIANLGFNLPRKSVLRPGPLIDWDLVLLFGPPTVMGSIAGSYINMVIPSWVTKVCLFVLLVPMAWRMVDKARSLFQRETAAKTAAKTSYEPDDLTAGPAASTQIPGKAAGTAAAGAGAAPAGFAAEAQAVGRIVGADGSGSSSSTAADAAAAIGEVVGHTSSSDHETSTAGQQQQQQQAVDRLAGDLELGSIGKPVAAAAATAAAGRQRGGVGSDEVQRDKAVVSCWQQPSKDPTWSCRTDLETCQAVRDKLAREQAQMVPPFQCGLLVLLLADVAVASLLAGYLLTCGSWQYWLLVLSPLLVMLLVWAVARHHVLWKVAWRTKLDMVDAGDLKWDTHTTTTYPAICISAGVIAGMLGLGGGLVLAPLMLELGVNPAVSAASTQVTLLISSSTSAIVYAVNGAVPWDYGIVLTVIGFLATLSGQWLVSWLVRRLGRPSILVITLAVMFAAAMFAAAAVLVITFVDLSQHPSKWFARKGVCVA